MIWMCRRFCAGKHKKRSDWNFLSDGTAVVEERSSANVVPPGKIVSFAWLFILRIESL